MKYILMIGFISMFFELFACKGAETGTISGGNGQNSEILGRLRACEDLLGKLQGEKVSVQKHQTNEELNNLENTQNQIRQLCYAFFVSKEAFVQEVARQDDKTIRLEREVKALKTMVDEDSSKLQALEAVMRKHPLGGTNGVLPEEVMKRLNFVDSFLNKLDSTLV